MSLYKANQDYYHDDKRLEGYIAYDEALPEKLPAVLVVHDWSGRNVFACEKAEMLSKLGFVGFAVDMYGEARIGQTVDEKKALMGEVIGDRAFLQTRIKAAFDTVAALDKVDAERIAVIGFCFGGLCALDLARCEPRLKGAVSFHGLLSKPEKTVNEPIQAKILVLHGYDDPMVTPSHVTDFCDEMTKAHADWQVNMYGHTQHGFTNPKANDKTMGTVYNPHVEHLAFQAMKSFLNEIFV